MSSPLTPPLVQIRDLSKDYLLENNNRLPVLRGVDFRVASGDFVAITGASGSGKSTLLHICGCLDRPSSGSYFLDGRDVSRLNDGALSQLRQSYIGFVFQDFNLLPHSDVFQNVALPFLYSTVEKEQWQPRVLAALTDVGLAQRKNHRPAALSGGERQRVAIARALVARPQLLLADEPTGNLDSVTSGEILALFTKLHGAGATIVLVTHDPEVAACGSRQMLMRDGVLEELG